MGEEKKDQKQSSSGAAGGGGTGPVSAVGGMSPAEKVKYIQEI